MTLSFSTSRPQRGFSLVELIVALAVMGVLSTAAIPLLEVSAQRSRERELKRSLWEIRDAIDAYKRAADTGLVEKTGEGFPKTLQVLVDGVPLLSSGGGRRYFLRRIPRDPFANLQEYSALGWGLRSYRSEPSAPEPGDDVYDVFTRSDRTALDGSKLKKW